MRWFLFVMFITAAVSAGCDSPNECESFASALCGYASFNSDTNDSRAKQRAEDCTCITKGPDSLETDYQKLNCTSRSEYLSSLSDRAETGAQTLAACKAAHAVLDREKDRYIEVCVQTGGAKDCKDALDGCTKGCSDSCAGSCKNPADYAVCNNCLTPCLGGCSITYPCDQMCSVFDFTTFGPDYGGGGGGGGGTDAGVPTPCENATEGDDCTGGYCAIANGAMTCAPSCPKAGVTCSIGSCYYLSDTVQVCTPAGSLAEDDPCNGFHDCAAGLQCLSDGTSNSCFKVCTNDNQCNAPKTCVDTGHGFKVCTAPAG